MEIRCERRDQLGKTIRYVIALTDLDSPPATELEALEIEAARDNRIVVPIARKPGPTWLEWDDFLQSLGGAIPSLRVVEDSFADVILTASRNEPVPGIDAQAWSVFETAVADGLEFILGLRVRRLGGVRRGRRVSDILAPTPDERVLVVDAKASSSAYEISTDTQRQLGDYVGQARAYQRGVASIGSAVIVSREFAQAEARLTEIAGQFLADYQAPLSFLTVDQLLAMIRLLRDCPPLRGAIRWARIFCQGGLITEKRFATEVQNVREQRVNER